MDEFLQICFSNSLFAYLYSTSVDVDGVNLEFFGLDQRDDGRVLEINTFGFWGRGFGFLGRGQLWIVEVWSRMNVSHRGIHVSQQKTLNNR